MIRILLPILGALVFWFTSCATSESAPTRESQSRLKGVELYSWRDSGKGWRFSLLDGTNRRKSAEEIQRPENVVQGLRALEAAFFRLAEGERVYWGEPGPGFASPSMSVCSEIARSARKAGVQLNLPTERFPESSH
ncbi:MAG: hypothetical protein ACI87O_002224 [Planctomycetota bacterium]|jgi:hypothetical protein